MTGFALSRGRPRGARRQASPVGRTLLCLALCGALASGCHTDAEGEHAAPAAASIDSASSESLPSVELRDDTDKLLLTWVDGEGEFHVGEKVTEVPEGNREHVRVVFTDTEAGTGASVYVANLTQKSPSGTYNVEAWPRERWDALGAEHREARMEAFAPSARPSGSAAPEGKEPAPVGSLSATIYGADWCKPCHDAENLLKQLGVQVTKKNIESSPAAAAEMRQKLAKSNRQGASIPVIDLAGRVFVGFNPGVLKQLVTRLRSGIQ